MRVIVCVAATPEHKRPIVNPLLETTSKVGIMASVVVVLVTIIRSWTSEIFADSWLSMVAIVGGVFGALLALRWNRRLTRKRDEWDYRQSVKILEERELVIEDSFVFSRIFKNVDNPSTYLFHYLISGGELFQVHPYEDERFTNDNLGVGSVIQAKTISEHDQIKILEYVVVKRVAPTAYPNNSYPASGIITEKYFGYKPNGIKGQTQADFPRVIADPRVKQEIAASISLTLRDNVLESQKEGKTDKFYFRINRHFERVSPEDFLRYPLGTAVTFTRNEKNAISLIEENR